MFIDDWSLTYINYRTSWDKGCNGLGASNPLSGN